MNADPITRIRELTNSLIDAIADAAQALAQEPSGERWHPVSEPLPTRDLRVLVIDKRGIITVARLKHGYWSTVPGDYTVNPTYWRPLPAPPVTSQKEQPR